MQTPHPGERSSNRLLDSLPAADRDRWFAKLTPAFLVTRRVLFEPSRAMDSVYFPLDAIISLLAPLESGAGAEVATVGDEGVAGVPPLLDASPPVRALCQVGGWVLRMDPRAFLEAVNGSAVVSAAVSDYLQTLAAQVAQATACHRLHSTEERLSRWLLMRQDRLRLDSFAVTHEVIAEMLGCQRPTVTHASRVLQAAGLIRNHRGVVTVIDRRGLEHAACECYGVITAAITGTPRADLRGRGHRLERAPAQQGSPRR